MGQCSERVDGVQCGLAPNHDGLCQPGRPRPEQNRVGLVPASERQVGGNHYRKFQIQPWDVIDEYELGYYSGLALKYLLRAGGKGSRLEDYKKCRHVLDKLIEIEEAKE